MFGSADPSPEQPPNTHSMASYEDCSLRAGAECLTSLLMLAKLTSKNQLTLPKQVLEALGRPSHFTVEVEDGRLVLSPAQPAGAAEVRRKLVELGITDADITDAVNWVRSEP